MGKYKQWLHHQEIGRRLRDQINTLEQERARVQKMAPTHATSLPELENPLISALLNFTRQGNKLSNIDVIKAAMPKLDPDQRQPAGSAATTTAAYAPTAAPLAPVARPAAAPTPANANATVGDSAVVASLLARADHMPSDPLEQMRELSRARETENAPLAAPAAPPTADTVGGWWQRQRDDD